VIYLTSTSSLIHKSSCLAFDMDVAYNSDYFDKIVEGRTAL